MAKVTFLKGEEALITVAWRRWFGLRRPEIKTYRGSVTVWRDAKTGERAPAHIEAALSDIYARARWGRE